MSPEELDRYKKQLDETKTMNNNTLQEQLRLKRHLLNTNIDKDKKFYYLKEA